MRSGASLRRIALFDDLAEASAESIVSRVTEALEPNTRLVALTWVHSSTGLKIPAGLISAAIEEVNAQRDEANQVLFGLDAVHGFGVEDAGMAELGCDFFMSGCHKWLFGPRGTGIIAFSNRGLAASNALIPSFADDAVYMAWLEGEQPGGSNSGQRMTPGGFKAFEHRWALTEAFELHGRIGRQRIAERTYGLATALKERLLDVPGVILRTPGTVELSSGIVSFDLDGQQPSQVVSALRERDVIASVAPYARPHVRLTPSVRNSEAEIESVVEAVAEIA